MSDRREAANLLRAVRSVGVDRAGDLLEWAVTIMPDRPTVQRLHVQALLSAGDVAGAESAIARALLARPLDPSLGLLHAECLAKRGKYSRAYVEVNAALERRPHHRRTRKLAARLANQCGDHLRAIALLDEATYLHGDQSRALLIEALLGVGNVQRARWTLEAMQSPPPTLTAAVLHAEGRLLDAAEVLQCAVESARGEVEDDVLCMLLSVLERTGEAATLQRAMDRVGKAHVKSRAFVGRLLLSQGRFRTAALHAYAMLKDTKHYAEALPTLVVAAAMLGRPRLARRALARLRRTREGSTARIMAERWQRGMLGKLLRTQHDAKQAGCDPGSSVLEALLHDAGRGVATARPHLKKSRRIKDSAGGVAQLSERKNVLVSSPVD